MREHFPTGGDRVTVFFHDVDFAVSLSDVHRLVQNLKDADDVVASVDSWTEDFVQYYNEYFADGQRTLPETQLHEEEFSHRFGQFLFSPRGGRYVSL